MSELWTVALFFRGHGRQINLLYGGEAAARGAFVGMVKEFRFGMRTADYAPADTEVQADHYGTSIVVLPYGPVECVMLQDNAKAHEGAIEGSLIQARAQAKANTRAQHDPQLKFVSGGGMLPGRPG
jgi:hypothetical protein